ncbi:hypothetical protein NUW54_g10883 [Trametes sanguinea]|uniref:Uncharacterized protein n=1 Tax=Trametes sanguinea TaxID=158606 RepID=A0ACC1NR26_9APHY|nr:hypothetical protein NUW54_g10883 [Trametes sanguinea]
MATLTRPRIPPQVQDIDEPRRPLSLDIPTPFPRLPTTSVQSGSESSFTPGEAHASTTARDTVATVNVVSAEGIIATERTIEGNGTIEQTAEVADTDSVCVPAYASLSGTLTEISGRAHILYSERTAIMPNDFERPTFDLNELAAHRPRPPTFCSALHLPRAKSANSEQL